MQAKADDAAVLSLLPRTTLLLSVIIPPVVGPQHCAFFWRKFFL